MTLSFQITNSTTTVDFSKLTGNTYAWIDDYAPTNSGQATVTETAKIVFKDSSLANVLATIHALERLLEEAGLYDDSDGQLGAPVYVKQNFNGTTYRSPLKRENRAAPVGKIAYNQQALHEGIIDARFEVDAIFTRANYFEADTEAELTTATTGNDITNFGTIEIDEALITGVAPGACRAEIKSTYAGTLGQLWIGNNAHKGSAFPPVVVEFEAGTGITGAVDAACSGGNKGSFTWATDVATLAGRWTISAVDLAKYDGHAFHFLLRTPASNSGIYAQLKVCATSTTTPLETPPDEVLMDANQIQDLGVLHLPPARQSAQSYYPVDLLLYVRKVGGGTVNGDCFLLLPTDAWRVLTPISGGVAQNAVLKDDPILDELYVDGVSTTQRLETYQPEGQPILLHPGRDNQLVIVGMDTSGVALPARSFNVKIFGRPRLATL